MLLVAVLANELHRRIARSVHSLRDTAQKVAAGVAAARAPETGPKEIADVARQLNAMLDVRRESEQSLLDSEAQYRMLFEISLDAFLRTLPDGSLLRATPPPVACSAAAQRCCCNASASSCSGEVTIELDPNVPVAAWLLGDRTRLRQIVVHLLTNAIKYNRRGGSVQVGLTDDGLSAGITVQDDRRGMAQEQLSELFQQFKRPGVEASTIKGTGLGLSIAKQLVQTLNGSIDVQSQLGQGTRFSIVFASIPAPQRPMAADPTAPTHDAMRVDTRACTVLCIEDNASNVMLLREILALRRATPVEAAVEGRSGLEAARRLRPDLILLDINRPDIDGFEILRRLRAEPALAAVPCVALSANAKPEDMRRARLAGFTAYVTKPLEFDILLDTVNGLMTAASQHAPLAG